MSYILQALKKAEDARGATPRAVEMPRALPPVARQRWPWITGGLVALAGAIAVATLWPLEPVTTDTPARTAVVSASLPPRGTVPTTAVAPAVVAPMPARLPEPAPAVATDVGPEPPPSPTVETTRPAPTAAWPPASTRPPRPSAPAAVPAPVKRPTSTVEGTAAAVTRPPSARQDAAALPAPAASPVGPRSETAAPPPSAGAPASDLKAMVARLSLQVLSWSPDPKDRFVFVNGRKYVEGQAVDDKLLIERITDGGLVLSYQGERATLKSP